MTKTKLVVGSLLGAVAIQLAMACVANTSNPGGTNGEDAGIIATVDSAVDAVIDAIANVIGDSATTKDASAQSVDSGSKEDGGGGGSCTCSGVTSGTRLKGVYSAGADGSKGYTSGVWFDSTLNVDCSSGGVMSDNATHCIPGGLTIQGTYTDSSCTHLFVYASPGYQYAVNYTVSGTTSIEHVYALGASTTTTVATPVYFNESLADGGTGCEAAGTLPVGTTVSPVGAEVAPSTFVTMTTGHD